LADTPMTGARRAEPSHPVCFLAPPLGCEAIVVEPTSQSCQRIGRGEPDRVLGAGRDFTPAPAPNHVPGDIEVRLLMH